MTASITELPNCPPPLLEAIHTHGGEVERISDHHPRFHIRLRSAQGALFGWYSTDPDDVDILRYELDVRNEIGIRSPLRTPAVLESGEDWRLERMVDAEPVAGRRCLELVVEAWQQLAGLDLPTRPKRAGGRVLRTLARRLRLIRSPLPVRDLARAKRIVATCELPHVFSHGDFHAAHVLPSNGSVFVIDWELAGMRPLGFDLMQLWASLEGEEDRAVLMDVAVDRIGTGSRRALAGLCYAAVVKRIASKVAEHRQFGDTDLGEAERLLALLPELREGAQVPRSALSNRRRRERA